MLIAHEVSPSNIDDDESRRAEFGTSLRLAASRFARLLFDTTERCCLVHAKNIAGFWTNFRVINLFRMSQRAPKFTYTQHC